MRYAEYPTEDRPYNSSGPCCTSKVNRDFTKQTINSLKSLSLSISVSLSYLSTTSPVTRTITCRARNCCYIFLINSTLRKTPGKSLSSSRSLWSLSYNDISRKNYLSKHNTAGGWQGSGFVALWSHRERFFAAQGESSQPIL